MVNQGAKRPAMSASPRRRPAQHRGLGSVRGLAPAGRRPPRPRTAAKSLRDALILNQRLWTIFQTAMTEPDCPLPRGDSR